MPLLRDGLLIENDPWTLISDDEPLPSEIRPVIVSVPRLLAQSQDSEASPGGPPPGGVSVAPADNVEVLAPFIDQLSLICIEFPAYTDGRGYSHARLLRNRLGYQGELRAVGDVRADQILFMQRLGIDAFDCNTLPDYALIKMLVTRFEYNYQASYPLPTTA